MKNAIKLIMVIFILFAVPQLLQTQSSALVLKNRVSNKYVVTLQAKLSITFDNAGNPYFTLPSDSASYIDYVGKCIGKREKGVGYK